MNTPPPSGVAPATASPACVLPQAASIPAAQLWATSLRPALYQAAVVCAALCWLAAAPAGLKAATPEDQQVEEFLSRLGLIDLQTLHLENVLERALPAKERLATARRLADLYAARLMQSADDKARYDETLAHIRSLVERIPEANTTSLQVMLLQADFSRAEAQITHWMENHEDTAALEAAGQILARIAPRLESSQQELNGEVEKLGHDIDMTKDMAKLAVMQQELRRRTEVAGRATFFAGWANYYYGIARGQDAGAAATFDVAKSAFRRFLGLDPSDKYEDIETDWLGLQSAIRSQALIGLAESEVATGNLDGARTLFKLLDDVSTPPAIREQGPAYFLQALLNANQIPTAAEYAGQQVAAFAGRATQGKVRFCVTLLRIGFSSSKPELRALGVLGVHGLGRLREIGLAQQVLAKYDVKLDDVGDFYLIWLKGQTQIAEAEKTKNADDFGAAAETLRKALANPPPTQDAASVAAAGQCRYTLALCLYRQEQYESAAEQFQQAATALKDVGGDSAVQSAWAAFVSYNKLATKERRFVSSAVDVLEGIKRDFPASKQAKDADLYLAKLRQARSSPEETIAALSKIQPGTPNYLSARFDLCRLYHQQWGKARGSDAADLAAQLERAADTYLFAARNDDNNERKLWAMLWAADVAINGVPPNLAKAQERLGKAEPLAAGLPASSTAAADYHYKCYQRALKQDDSAEAQKHADWLAKNAAGSAYEQVALMMLAKAADAAVGTAAAQQRLQRVREAAEIYRRLVRVVGESSTLIAKENNARVANVRLAQYDYEMGNFGEAADRAERLVEAFPDNREYLRLAGLAQYFAGRYQASIAQWRTLVQGLTKNSKDWYEAKYYQLASLAHFDKPEAVKAYRQFKLLYPKVEGEPWRSDREGLQRMLAK